MRLFGFYNDRIHRYLNDYFLQCAGMEMPKSAIIRRYESAEIRYNAQV